MLSRTSLAQRVCAGGIATILTASAVGVMAAPGLIAQRLEARAERAGVRLTVNDVGIGWSGVRLGSVEVSLPNGTHAFLRAQNARVGLGWFDALSAGAKALKSVSAESATIELSAAEIAELKQRRSSLQKAGAEPGSTAEAKLGPTFSVGEFNVRVLDEEGVLFEASAGTARAENGGWELTLSELSVGLPPHDEVKLRGVRASGELVAGRPVFGKGSADGGTLSWESAGGEPKPGSSTLSRLRALRDAVRGEAVESDAADSAQKREPKKLWASDARLTLQNLRVVEAAIGSGESPTILDGLSAAVELKGEESVRVTGKGNAPGTGHVSWDLTAVPAQARIEGTLSVQDVSLALLGPVLPPLPFSDLEHTRVRADLELTGLGLESIAVKGSLRLNQLAFDSEGLAKTAVGPFDFTAQGEGTWTPARRELAGLKAQLKSGATAISLTGMLAWPKDGYNVNIVAELPKSRCSDVLASVPRGLLDELATLKLGGTLGGKLTFQVDAANLDATKVDFDVKDACKFEELPTALDLRKFARPFLHQVLEPDGTLFETETGPGAISWTAIEHVSPFFIQAVVAHEDGRFFTHHGFAEPEIGVALARNLKAKAFKFGASTITMQLVKNVFLHRDKLLARKVQEALIVWWLEQQWDKRRILELYLNVIEYGPGIYGIRDAALHYFGTLPIYLTPAQAGFLACVLPSPKSSHVHYEKKALSTSARNRISNLLKHMALRERIDAEALAYGLEELERFRFYDPTLPPPVPPEVRGTAQKPPFKTADVILDPWESYVPDEGRENGAFGQP